MGRRMGGGIRKPYLTIADKPVLAHTILPFEHTRAVASIIVVTAPGDEDFCLKNVVKRFGFQKVAKVIPGGKERQDSVMSGIMAADGGWDLVVVHDGARPFVTKAIIERVIRAAKETIKQVAGYSAGRLDGFVKKTLNREELWAVQTPQAFSFDMLKRAHNLARKHGFVGTDDSILVERLGHKVAVVKGLYENIKITTPEDIVLGKAILNNRLRA